MPKRDDNVLQEYISIRDINNQLPMSSDTPASRMFTC